MNFVPACKILFLNTACVAFCSTVISCAHTASSTSPLNLLQTVSSVCSEEIKNFSTKKGECAVYAEQRGTAMSNEINCIGRVQQQRSKPQPEGKESSFNFGTKPVRFQWASYEMIGPKEPDTSVPPPPINRYPECIEFSRITDQKIKLTTDCYLELLQAHRTGRDCIHDAERKYKEQHPESTETLPQPTQPTTSPTPTSSDT